MDLPTKIIIKEELLSLNAEDTNENVLIINFNVKKREKQQFDSDWCIQNPIYCNPDSVDSTQKYSDPVSCAELKKYCYQKCFLCSELFPNSYSLAQHNLSHMFISLQAPNLHQCDYCLVYYTEKPDLISHINRKHGHEYYGVPKTRASHQCKICLKSFTYRHWHGHMANVHGEKIKCHKCNVVFKCQRYLRRHNLYVHKVSKRLDEKIKCDQCPKIFKNRDCINHHVQNCHGELVECGICKSKLKSKSYLNSHMRRVHYDDGKIHKCKICLKQFKSPRYVSIHIKNAHENKRTKQVKLEKNRKTSYAPFDIYLRETR